METDFVQLGRCLLKAFARQDYQAVRRTAAEYLRAAERHRSSANYGNAIHQVNTLLGLIELEADRAERAKRYLLDSARTPGSRQLRAFGPSMLLAQRMLERGHRKAVIEYLEACGSIWRLSFGQLWRWRRQIRQGRTPNFGYNLSYLIDYKSFG